MAYYGGYNYAFVGYDEIFDPRGTPMPFRMDLEEIREPPEIEAYGHNNYDYNNQVQQFYFNDHNNGSRRDSDQNDRNNRGNYVPDQIPFPMDRRELQEISVPIRLSDTENINSLMATLFQYYELRCSRAGNVLTVTGYSSSGPNEFLNIVQEVSGDRWATIVRRS